MKNTRTSYKQKTAAFAIAAALWGGSASAQNAPLGYYHDVPLFGQVGIAGSARFQGIAGASTALGGDISSARSNPAGLGFNRKTIMTVSPAFNSASSKASYFGETPYSDSRLNMNFNNFGIMFGNEKAGSEDKFFGGTFAINYTRQTNFNSSFTYKGEAVIENPDGSLAGNNMVDYLLEKANNGDYNSNDLEEKGNANNLTNIVGLAYWTYLLDPLQGKPSEYDSFIPLTPTKQQETVTNSGRQGQWDIAYGGNWNDRVYFGAALGIQSINFKKKSTFTEDYSLSRKQKQNGTVLPAKSLEIIEETGIKGKGLNFSAGLIVRPIDLIRVGVNFTSPSILGMQDSYTADMTVIYDNYKYDSLTTLATRTAQSASVQSSYKMVSPAKASLGAAIFLGKAGFISADLEYVGYRGMRFYGSNAGDDFFEDNKAIKDVYRNGLNMRLGGEARLGPLKLRGGVAYNSDPYKLSADEVERYKIFYTAGGGIQRDKMFFDVAFVTTTAGKAAYSPYTLNNNAQPIVDVSSVNVNAVFTLGFVL